MPEIGVIIETTISQSRQNRQKPSSYHDFWPPPKKRNKKSTHWPNGQFDDFRRARKKSKKVKKPILTFLFWPQPYQIKA